MIDKLRDHLKSSHIADKRKNFHMGGRGLDPICCAIGSQKKEKKKVRSSTDPAAVLADKSKSPIKCRKSLRDLEQVQEKRREVHAYGCNQSIADIDWLLKVRFEGAKQAITGTRSSSTLDLHWPPAFEHAETETKVEIVSFFNCLRFFLCSFRNQCMDAEPPGKRPCVRPTTLFGQVVGKNEDNVHSHLPHDTPIVDHTFV